MRASQIALRARDDAVRTVDVETVGGVAASASVRTRDFTGLVFPGSIADAKDGEGGFRFLRDVAEETRHRLDGGGGVVFRILGGIWIDELGVRLDDGDVRKVVLLGVGDDGAVRDGGASEVRHRLWHVQTSIHLDAVHQSNL